MMHVKHYGWLHRVELDRGVVEYWERPDGLLHCVPSGHQLMTDKSGMFRTIPSAIKAMP